MTVEYVNSVLYSEKLISSFTEFFQSHEKLEAELPRSCDPAVEKLRILMAY